MNDSEMKQRLLEKDVITAVKEAMDIFSYAYLDHGNVREVFALAADNYLSIEITEANKLNRAKEMARKNQESEFLREYFRERLAAYVGMFSEGLAPIMTGNEWGFINESGEVVVEIKYSSVEAFSDGLVRVAVVSQGDYKFGFVDKTGKEVIEPKYDHAESFAEGLAVVKLNDDRGYGVRYKKCGFIDKTGMVVIELKYEDAESFENGLAKVKQNDVWLSIDKNGQPQGNPK